MSKKGIYAASYDADPKNKDEILEALQVRKAERERTKALGQMLKEERARNQELQRRINRLEEEKSRLAAVVAKSHR